MFRVSRMIRLTTEPATQDLFEPAALRLTHSDERDLTLLREVDDSLTDVASPISMSCPARCSVPPRVLDGGLLRDPEQHRGSLDVHEPHLRIQPEGELIAAPDQLRSRRLRFHSHEQLVEGAPRLVHVVRGEELLEVLVDFLGVLAKGELAERDEASAPEGVREGSVDLVGRLSSGRRCLSRGRVGHVDEVRELPVQPELVDREPLREKRSER